MGGTVSATHPNAAREERQPATLQVFDGDVDAEPCEWLMTIPTPGVYRGRAWTPAQWRNTPRDQRPERYARVAGYYVIYEYVEPLT
jgi:hypothetical protein